jgi:uncharacterized protein (UPF0147 family)
VVEMGLEGALQLLEQICEDRTIPKNIREQCESAKNMLGQEEKEVRVKIDAVLEVMDNISEDPNLPIYARTQIWNIVSMLESI